MNEKAIQTLIDRQEILDCLTRYCRGVDRRDRELLLSAYHSDAIDDHGPLVGSAEDMFEWGRLRDRTGPEMTEHHITNHSCDIDGDTAHAETYFIYVARNRDESVWTAGGRYIDRIERRDGEWKIAMRYCVLEWSSIVPEGPNPFAGIADLHANGVPGRNRDDPSYRRPLVNNRELQFPAM